MRCSTGHPQGGGNAMSLAAESRSCPTCWSTRCLAGKGSPYRHRWEDGPMAAAHHRWKDHRTPPAGPEEVTNVETLSSAAATDETPTSVSNADHETLSATTCEECGEPFVPVRRSAKFCSPACRLKAHRRATETAARAQQPNAVPWMRPTKCARTSSGIWSSSPRTQTSC